MTPWKPHAYQVRAVKWLLNHPEAALFLDPGLGKTSVALAALKMLRREGKSKKALVIAPVRVCWQVWPREARDWQDFAGLRVVVLHGKDKENVLQSGDYDIACINPEGLGWLLKEGEINPEVFRKFGFDALIVDELTKFKHPGTARFKMLRKVLHTFDRRWGLTGSPAANHLIDLFGQCYVLDLGRSLGRYITHFRNEYFIPDFMGYVWTPKPNAEKRIQEKVAPLALRMSAEEYLAMPELQHVRIPVALPEDAREIYTRLERDLFVQLDTDEILATSAAVLSTKCRQVTGGAVYTTGADVSHIHDAKLEALESLVDELQGQPLLVAYDYQHESERIRKHIAGAIDLGAIPRRKFDTVIAKWRRGEIPVMVAHPQSAGHGLNLQGACSHVCFFTAAWNYELVDQFIRRVYRQGSKAKRVTVHYLEAQGTIDGVVLDTLQRKEATQEGLFKALEQYRKEVQA